MSLKEENERRLFPTTFYEQRGGYDNEVFGRLPTINPDGLITWNSRRNKETLSKETIELIQNLQRRKVILPQARKYHDERTLLRRLLDNISVGGCEGDDVYMRQNAKFDFEQGEQLRQRGAVDRTAKFCILDCAYLLAGWQKKGLTLSESQQRQAFKEMTNRYGPDLLKALWQPGSEYYHQREDGENLIAEALEQVREKGEFGFEFPFSQIVCVGDKYGSLETDNPAEIVWSDGNSLIIGLKFQLLPDKNTRGDTINHIISVSHEGICKWKGSDTTGICKIEQEGWGALPKYVEAAIKFWRQIDKLKYPNIGESNLAVEKAIAQFFLDCKEFLPSMAQSPHPVSSRLLRISAGHCSKEHRLHNHNQLTSGQG